MKKLNELDKSEKLLLLELIANKQIDPKIITGNSLFATENYYAHLDDENVTVFCLGPARLELMKILARPDRGIITIEIIDSADQVRKEGNEIPVMPANEIMELKLVRPNFF